MGKWENYKTCYSQNIKWSSQVSSKWGGWLRRHIMNSRGQQKVGGPSAVWLDEWLVSLPHKNQQVTKSYTGHSLNDLCNVKCSLGNICVPKREEVTRKWKKFADWEAPKYAILKKCYLRDQTEDEAMIAACGLYGGTKEIFKGLWCVDLKKRDKTEDRSWDGRIVGHGVDSPDSGEGTKRALVKNCKQSKNSMKRVEFFYLPRITHLEFERWLCFKEGSNLVTETMVIVSEPSKERSVGPILLYEKSILRTPGFTKWERF